MVNIAEKPTLLVVTYGTRYELLLKTLRAARSLVDKIVVVLNGDTDVDVDRLSAEFRTIAIVAMESNLGSAGGVAAGLEHILRDRQDGHTLILDDDNVITDADWPRVNSFLTVRQLTSLSFVRSDRGWQRAMLERGRDRPAAVARRSCLGFDLVEYLSKRPVRSPNTRKDFVETRWAPWGGLLVSNQAVRSVGGPDARWFAYFDDCEFTYRMSRSGFPIFVTDAVCIDDADSSWNNVEGAGRRWIDRLLKNGDDWRVALAVRNQAYFEATTYPREGLLFGVNAFVLGMKIMIRGAQVSRWRRATNLVCWYLEGVRGRRGRL